MVPLSCTHMLDNEYAMKESDAKLSIFTQSTDLP
jgi:hypothetical protein